MSDYIEPNCVPPSRACVTDSPSCYGCKLQGSAPPPAQHATVAAAAIIVRNRKAYGSAAQESERRTRPNTKLEQAYLAYVDAGVFTHLQYSRTISCDKDSRHKLSFVFRLLSGRKRRKLHDQGSRWVGTNKLMTLLERNSS